MAPDDAGDVESQVRPLARKYALQNAVEHGGEANTGAVMGRIMAEAPELRPHAKSIPPIVGRVVGAVNGLDAAAQRAELEETAPELLEPDEAPEDEGPALPDLPGDTDKVVLRFAPNPNGPATLGHSRGMVIMSQYKARYGGELILRYDDTDPVVKAPEDWAYGMILDDYEWLGETPDRVIKASERLPTYYEAAEETIRLGGAYVCECTGDQFREFKNAKKACPHRGRGADENRKLWREMLDGGFQPGDAVLRVKTDMAHKDPALRDWVAFRIVDIENHPHPVTGTTHRVWPLLDFQSAVEDHLQGVTHIIRGKDLMDSTRKQKFLYDHHGWTYPETRYWGRVRMHEFGKFSTSRLKEAIAAGEYTGWDDPRLPTLRALRRRGFQPEAIRNFWLELGVTQKDIAASAKNLDAENRKVVDPAANRYFLVRDPAALRVATTEALTARAPLHPDDPDRGAREHALEPEDGEVTVLVESRDLQDLSVGDVVRLKDLGNVRVTGDGAAEYVGDDLDVLDQGASIIHWVPDGSPPASILRPDGSVDVGVVERPALAAGVDAVVQFERVGFARVDAVDDDGLVAVFAHK